MSTIRVGNIGPLTGNTAPMVSVMSGPAFLAQNTSSSFSMPGSSYVKVNFASETFDTNSCYDPSTSRFIPNVPGYYMIGMHCSIGAYSGRWSAYLYKNGSGHTIFCQNTGNGSNDEAIWGSKLIYATGNGTDYYEVYVQGNNTATFYGGAVDNDCYFYAHLARPV